MSKHTPGPWKVRNVREVFCGNKRICHVNAASREPLSIKDDWDVAAANARLIAAAPDLLEALLRTCAALESVSYSDPSIASAINTARAAIAKATGEKA